MREVFIGWFNNLVTILSRLFHPLVMVVSAFSIEIVIRWSSSVRLSFQKPSYPVINIYDIIIYCYAFSYCWFYFV